MKNESRHPRRRPFATTSALVLALLIGGCASVQDWPESVRGADAPAVASDPDMGRRKLAEGVERYEAGDFVSAIRALNAPEIEQSDRATRVEAGKYLAFTYCVTNRRTLCRTAFDRVLALDSTFALQPAEAGHPLWGPVFVQARKAADPRTR
ncbi:MAG TPA: TssQ family T6SS-associated lipoprotein [Zeimonas sp.]